MVKLKLVYQRMKKVIKYLIPKQLEKLEIIKLLLKRSINKLSIKRLLMIYGINISMLVNMKKNKPTILS